MRQLEGQMQLRFPYEKPKVLETVIDYCENCINWLCRVYDCSRDEIAPIVERLYAEFWLGEAFERAKVLKVCDGKHQVSGWTVQDAVSVIGIFNHDIDHHTCWDREWAARKGYTKEEVATVFEWDYQKGEPIFIGEKL